MRVKYVENENIIEGGFWRADKTAENINIKDLSDGEDNDFNDRNYGKKLTGPRVSLVCVRKVITVLLRQDILWWKNEIGKHYVKLLKEKSKSEPTLIPMNSACVQKHWIRKVTSIRL